MELEERHIWLGAGLGILIFLIITTPGWKEVLGVPSLSLDWLGDYKSALILLGFMGLLVGAVLFGNQGGEE